LLISHIHALFLHTDVKEESINLQNTTLKFKGKSDSKEYEVDIEFFKPVDAEGSTYKVLPRSVQMHVMKKKAEDGEDEEFWPRLLKDKALEKNQVKVDWDRYVDEDEEDEGFDTSMVSHDSVMYSMLYLISHVYLTNLSRLHSLTVEWEWEECQEWG
jgi:hypothetical protein